MASDHGAGAQLQDRLAVAAPMLFTVSSHRTWGGCHFFSVRVSCFELHPGFCAYVLVNRDDIMLICDGFL